MENTTKQIKAKKIELLLNILFTKEQQKSLVKKSNAVISQTIETAVFEKAKQLGVSEDVLTKPIKGNGVTITIDGKTITPRATRGIDLIVKDLKESLFKNNKFEKKDDEKNKIVSQKKDKKLGEEKKEFSVYLSFNNNEIFNIIKNPNISPQDKLLFLKSNITSQLQMQGFSAEEMGEIPQKINIVGANVHESIFNASGKFLPDCIADFYAAYYTNLKTDVEKEAYMQDLKRDFLKAINSPSQFLKEVKEAIIGPEQSADQDKINETLGSLYINKKQSAAQKKIREYEDKSLYQNLNIAPNNKVVDEMMQINNKNETLYERLIEVDQKHNANAHQTKSQTTKIMTPEEIRKINIPVLTSDPTHIKIIMMSIEELKMQQLEAIASLPESVKLTKGIRADQCQAAFEELISELEKKLPEPTKKNITETELNKISKYAKQIEQLYAVAQEKINKLEQSKSEDLYGEALEIENVVGQMERLIIEIEQERLSEAKKGEANPNSYRYDYVEQLKRLINDLEGKKTSVIGAEVVHKEKIREKYKNKYSFNEQQSASDQEKDEHISKVQSIREELDSVVSQMKEVIEILNDTINQPPESIKNQMQILENKFKFLFDELRNSISAKLLSEEYVYEFKNQQKTYREVFKTFQNAKSAYEEKTKPNVVIINKNLDGPEPLKNKNQLGD